MTLFDPDASLFPFVSHFVDIDGHTLHYVDEGEGPVLLMLHGNPTWSFLYRKLIAGLRDRFRCVAPDLPGFGLSVARPGFGFTADGQARVIARFIETLDLRDVTLVGQDWGGPIGLSWAIGHPERVRGLVLGNTWAWPLTGQRRYELFSWLMGGPIGSMAAWLFNGVWMVFFRLGLESELDPGVRSMYRAPFGPRHRRRPTSIFPRQLIRADGLLRRVEEGLPKLRDKPVLLPWGERDFAFRTAERERLAAAFPNHQVLLLPEASHFWQEDAPGPVVQAIRNWAP